MNSLNIGQNDQHLLAWQFWSIETPAFQLRQLARLTGDRSVEWIDRRFDFPLRQRHAIDYVQPNIALLGDAAHAIHPLAGQGVNLGLADAAALAEVLADARARNRDIGGHLTLRRYERWRKGTNLAMVYAMSGFNTLFGTDDKAVARLRGLGLGATDRIGPLKHGFARQAMGISGDLPQVMLSPG